jgi:hypothetical protein
MPKPWITVDDYPSLRAFFAHFAAVELGLEDPLGPLEALEQAAPRRAASGLRLAIQDCLELSADFGPARVRAADEALAALGLPTLSRVRVSHWRRAHVVLDRGLIRTQAERLAVRALADSDVDDDLRDRCIALLQVFDERRPAWTNKRDENAR